MFAQGKLYRVSVAREVWEMARAQIESDDGFNDFEEQPGGGV
jgi:hypothetical protein